MSSSLAHYCPQETPGESEPRLLGDVSHGHSPNLGFVQCHRLGEECVLSGHVSSAHLPLSVAPGDRWDLAFGRISR